MEPKYFSDFCNTLSAYVRASVQFILPKNVVLLACLIKFLKIIVYSLPAETGKAGWWFFWCTDTRLTEIAGSSTKTILELPQTVLMSQSGVWIFCIKLMYITSRNHGKCGIYVVHLAQHSAPDSKTQHKAFTGTSHRVLVNKSQKCCCFLLANP